MKNEKCVLYDRLCIDCGECDRCELDPKKICDNYMKCVTEDAAYRSILVEKPRIRPPKDEK